MDKKRVTIISVTSALVLAILVFAFLAFPAINEKNTPVMLPDAPDPGGEETGAESAGDTALENMRVKITPQTVQAVAAELSRPENYYMSVRMTTYWPDGSAESSAELWHSGEQDLIRTVQPDGRARNCLMDVGNVTVWYEGSEQSYTGPKGEITADDELRIFTYEDLLSAPLSAISAASYGTYADQGCIYVRLNENGRFTDLWIAADSGILLCCERTENGEKLDSMTVESLSIGTVEADMFTPPV